MQGAVDVADLDSRVRAQGDTVRKLKTEKASKVRKYFTICYPKSTYFCTYSELWEGNANRVRGQKVNERNRSEVRISINKRENSVYFLHFFCTLLQDVAPW